MVFGFIVNQKKIESLREEVARMDAEDHAIEVARLRTNSTPYLPTPVTPVTPIAPAPVTPVAAEPDPISEETKAIIASQEEKIEMQKQEIDALANKAETLETENEEIFEERVEQGQEQRMAAFRVKNALTMGTVTFANKSNALVTFVPSASANFQEGRVLAVRRNSGIIGKIQIDRLDDSGEYVATMRPHGYSPDGYPDIQPGDTIIIDLSN